jgi:hypothetical protein
MSKGATTKTININHRRKIRERRSFSLILPFPFSLIFSLFAPMYRSIFSFYFNFYFFKFSTCVLVFIFIMNKVTTKFLPLVKLQSLCHDDI